MLNILHMMSDRRIRNTSKITSARCSNLPTATNANGRNIHLTDDISVTAFRRRLCYFFVFFDTWLIRVVTIPCWLQPAGEEVILLFPTNGHMSSANLACLALKDPWTFCLIPSNKRKTTWQMLLRILRSFRCFIFRKKHSIEKNH